MTDSSKRVLTVDRNFAPDLAPPSRATSISDDLYEQLRSVGSRVRKNVTEGYKTAPSDSFIRSQTTSAIFCSSRDAIRHARYTVPALEGAQSQRKRAHSITEDSRADAPHTSAAPSTETSAQDGLSALPTDKDLRPTRPLRAPSRRFLQTQSLPAFTTHPMTGAFSADAPAAAAPQVPDEEDWSQDSFGTSDQPGFKPISFS